MTVTYHGLGEHGRLGNQLFQIAGTVGIAAGLSEPVALDPEWAYRPFFSLPDEWFADNWADKTEASSYATHLPQRWRKYLQDPDLFADIPETIYHAFQPSARAAAVLNALPQPGEWDVAVHVRRTDYKGRDGYLEMLPIYYYDRASERLFGPYGRFAADAVHVFSDDPEWCEENMPQHWDVRHYGETVVDEPTDWADLQMMARYHHHIVANSSYSWWAAYLSDDPSPVVPDPWFGPLIDVPSPALNTWTKVAA